MAFDASKDEELSKLKHAEGLEVSLRQYNGGDIKVQIGPRSYTNKDGELKYAKAGRLSQDEAGWIAGAIPKLLDTLIEGPG